MRWREFKCGSKSGDKVYMVVHAALLSPVGRGLAAATLRE
jgi:hypothetical protein